MKLDDFMLACGGELAVKAFLELCIVPYKIHADDMSEVVAKIIKVQDNISPSCRYCVSIWDSVWPHRVWMFDHEYSTFNRAEDEPACGHYVQPVFQVFAQRANGELQASVVQHVLKNPVLR